MAIYFSKRYKEYGKSGLTEPAFERLSYSLRRFYPVFHPETDAIYIVPSHGEPMRTRFDEDFFAFMTREHGKNYSKTYQVGFHYPDFLFEHAVIGRDDYIYLFDFIEFISEKLKTLTDLTHWASYQRNINEIFKEEGLNWHLSEDEILPLDARWVKKEIYDPAIKLLRGSNFRGVENEFQKAHACLEQGEYKDAILSASRAIESTIKTILDIDKPPNFEASLKKLYEAKIIPEYHEKFLEAFEKIIRPVIQMRNEERGVGHGQGKNINESPESLAELAVNLAGVIILYIVKCHNEKPKTEKPGSKKQESKKPETA